MKLRQVWVKGKRRCLHSALIIFLQKRPSAALTVNADAIGARPSSVENLLGANNCHCLFAAGMLNARHFQGAW